MQNFKNGYIYIRTGIHMIFFFKLGKTSSIPDNKRKRWTY